MVKNFPANAGDIRDTDSGSVPGSGRSPGGGQGNPLQYSCLENPIDRGAWRATVHRVTKSQTQLKCIHECICKYTNLHVGQNYKIWSDFLDYFSQNFYSDAFCLILDCHHHLRNESFNTFYSSKYYWWSVLTKMYSIFQTAPLSTQDDESTLLFWHCSLESVSYVHICVCGQKESMRNHTVSRSHIAILFKH